jgi:peptide-methionine (R)-S-oxide reductase
MRYIVIASAVLMLSFAGCAALVGRADDRQSAVVPNAAAAQVIEEKTVSEITFIDGEWDGKPVVKTEDEWKKLLSPAAYYVLRQEGTEKPYSGELNKNKKKGTYHCAACGLALFRSEAKFESGTGWPSFFKAMYKKNVTEKKDTTMSEERIEIECSRCGSHIGHVFDDGPEPTGLRYCMNSVSLKFQADK